MLTGQCGCSVLRVAGARLRRTPLPERTAQIFRIEQAPPVRGRCGRSGGTRMHGDVGQQFVAAGGRLHRQCGAVVVVRLALIGDGRCG